VELSESVSVVCASDVLLPIVGGRQLAGDFYASRSGVANHVGICNVNLLLKRVQSRKGLFVCAGGLEGQVAAGVEAGGDDDFVIGENAAGSVDEGHFDGVRLRIEVRGFA